MSAQIFKVLVFVFLQLLALTYSQNYPYPYPYAQQYNYQPMYPTNYPIYPSYQSPSYGYIPQSAYPSGYGTPVYGQIPQSPSYGQIPQSPSYGQIPQSPSYGQVPQGYPSGIPSQGGIYPAPFPYMPQTYVPTPYGNIPVEIIDVNPNQEPETSFTTSTSSTSSNNTSPELTPETSLTEEKKEFEIRKPVTTSSVIQSDPKSTTITRTLDPQYGKVKVTVQTSKPPVLKKQDNSIEKDDDEDNETTTKKYYSIFGR